MALLLAPAEDTQCLESFVTTSRDLRSFSSWETSRSSWYRLVPHRALNVMARLRALRAPRASKSATVITLHPLPGRPLSPATGTPTSGADGPSSGLPGEARAGPSGRRLRGSTLTSEPLGFPRGIPADYTSASSLWRAALAGCLVAAADDAPGARPGNRPGRRVSSPASSRLAPGHFGSLVSWTTLLAPPTCSRTAHVLLGKIQDLDSLVEETRPDIVVIAQMDRRGCFPTKALLECRLRGIRVEDWPTFYEKADGKILVTAVRPSWLIFSDGFVKTPRTEIIKRLFDISLALVGVDARRFRSCSSLAHRDQAGVSRPDPLSASPGSDRTAACSS